MRTADLCGLSSLVPRRFCRSMEFTPALSYLIIQGEMPRVLQERPLASLAALLHQGGGAEQSCNAGWVCMLVLI